VLLLLVGYLCGSIPFGVIVARCMGIDLTQVGSGNIGATNVARTLGKPAGALVLLLDGAKGFLPVFLAARAGVAPALLAGIALCAVLGHVFPVWLRFRGGKGVATGLGVLIALAPWAAAGALLLFGVVYGLTRVSALGSLTAAVAAPLIAWATGAPWPTVALLLCLMVVIVIRHRGNIHRLLTGTEYRV
jgi:acyl phosphate:glycerol-3-phosphate acyltransferase